VRTDPANIALLIKEGEGLTLEFKEHFTSRIDEDMVAFANTRGGVILLGVRDNGTVGGENLTNDLKAKIISMDKGERAGTGIQRMREALTAAGLEGPEIINESFFSIIFKRPLAESGAESGAESKEDVSLENDIQRILQVLATGEASAIEIAQSMQKKTVTGSLKRLLRELIIQGKIEHTIQDKPNSRLQKYRISQGTSHVE